MPSYSCSLARGLSLARFRSCAFAHALSLMLSRSFSGLCSLVSSLFHALSLVLWFILSVSMVGVLALCWCCACMVNVPPCTLVVAVAVLCYFAPRAFAGSCGCWCGRRVFTGNHVGYRSAVPVWSPCLLARHGWSGAVLVCWSHRHPSGCAVPSHSWLPLLCRCVAPTCVGTRAFVWCVGRAFMVNDGCCRGALLVCSSYPFWQLWLVWCSSCTGAHYD